MDVFIRWWPQNSVRQHLAIAAFSRISSLPNAKAQRIENFHCSGKPFHIETKRLAEQVAESTIYCVMDDDQLPIPNDFFEQGRSALENHPEYGMLAGFPLEYGLHGQPYAHRTEDVIEAHSIGCPYFVRKGTLSFPDGPLRQYDGILSKVVTDQGLKTGFARKCLYNHLGFGFSQVEQT